jgi:DNA polymerase V
MELRPFVPSNPTHVTSRLVGVRTFEAGDPLELPLYLSRVPAGFASPADDHVDAKLDLNEHCVKNPASTHLARVEGYSMIEFGINDGDVVVVDRSVEPVDGKIVIAALNGELTVKKLRITGKNGTKRMWLVAGNPDYPPTELLEGHELVIWGVVTHVIHKCG